MIEIISTFEKFSGTSTCKMNRNFFLEKYANLII